MNKIAHTGNGFSNTGIPSYVPSAHKAFILRAFPTASNFENVTQGILRYRFTALVNNKEWVFYSEQIKSHPGYMGQDAIQ